MKTDTKQITVQEYKIKVDTLFQKFQKPESEYHITELWNDIRSLSINFHDAELPSEEEIIKQLRLKASNCGDSTRESRARYGAYIDCITMIRELCKNPNNHELLPDISDIRQMAKMQVDSTRYYDFKSAFEAGANYVIKFIKNNRDE